METTVFALAVCLALALAPFAGAETVTESAREIPVAYDVDVVVIGGSTGAVSAAVEAAARGATVFLAAPRPYLGEDVCSTYRLWLEPGEEPKSPLAKQVFAEPPPALAIEKGAPFRYEADLPSAGTGPRTPPTLMQVKRTLDQALLKAGVTFLYGCYPTDVLRDASGNPAGIVMANRSGRQAVRAKVLVDATARGAVARMAGATFGPYPAGPQTFTRVVVGGQPHESGGVHAKPLPAPVQIQQDAPLEAAQRNAVEYEVVVPMRNGAFASFAQAEQVARDKTWDVAQVDASASLFQVPPDSMRGRKRIETDWPGAGEADLDVFRPADLERLYVLGGCADVSRAAAAKLVRPLALMDVGARIGRAAAEEAGRVAAANGVRVAVQEGAGDIAGEVREFLLGVRSFKTELPEVPAASHALPVLGRYDVVVVGGGTGGAPAAISAARHGAKTLVVEYLDGLGGVGTLGLIGKYYHGNLGGFTAEIDAGVAAIGGRPVPDEKKRGADAAHRHDAWNVEWKMEWYRRELRKAGADVWFGALGCGALVQDGRVQGVIVATPEGRGVVLATVVVDSTGNADIAVAAGASCMYADDTDVAVQGTGMPPRTPGASYTNTDWTITDDSDAVDIWRTFVAGRTKYRDAFDLAPIVDSRERRRVGGDFVISPLDILNRRTYPDAVALAESDFDTHGYTIAPVFAIRPPGRERLSANIPYRALLPKGLDGILVTGLGISAHRDAMPILRMQADIQNEGYAAGLAAAMAAKTGLELRNIDIKALQKELVVKTCVPERVLTDADSYPLPKEKLEAAVKDLVNGYSGIEVVLTQPEAALPVLRGAYAGASTSTSTITSTSTSTRTSTSTNEDKVVYAHVLAMLGDPSGLDTLVAAVDAQPWDPGWTYTGMGQYGGSLSRLDSLIVALGHTRDARALPVILNKVALLSADSEFSHHRAVALALETLGKPEAAPALAALLKKPGMMDHATTTIEKAEEAAGLADPNLDRSLGLRELILARALYRCGDFDRLGEHILKEYVKDLRGHLARHAQAVLLDR